ncbi:MAG: hypothetical protein Nk1A_8370 [Endomicrobiia bacterium]|nr:MAG: hypothetical protein Nk1A_8370 [Endomicrobiia bacterium]
MSACKIVTISKKRQLFKNGEAANAIELLEFIEVGNTVVAGINTFNVGDKVLFIEPDYCIPDTKVFSDYYYPDGNSNKNKLGKNGRIKAIKFSLGLSAEDNGPIYSYGIIIPLNKVYEFIPESRSVEDFDQLLNIIKYVEPETIHSGSGKSFPVGMYKTDEVNINNLWQELTYPIKLIGTQKIDGSSITLYCRKVEGVWESGICSRNLEKDRQYNKLVGSRNPTIFEKIVRFFIRQPINEKVKIYRITASDDVFVEVGEPYLNVLTNYCQNHNRSIALRGELNGYGVKGSGSKNNPTINEERNIKFFSSDHFENGIAVRDKEEDFQRLISDLGFNRCRHLFCEIFNSREEIEEECNKVFKFYEDEYNIMMEGVVLRDLNAKFSAKLMNLKYDSRK